MLVSQLAKDLELFFAMNNYTWRLGGRSVAPLAEDIQKVLDRAAERLYDEETEAQLEVGRLIFKSRPDASVIEVYAYMGDIER